MRFDAFTIKAQEAIQGSLTHADAHHHTQIEPEHLALTLLQQEDSIVKPVLQKVGVDTTQLQNTLLQHLKRQPQVQGSNAQPGLAAETARILTNAQSVAEK